MPKTVRLKISTLLLDPSVQSRVEINPLRVDEYAEAMKRGETFPPIKVFLDAAKHNWVADGFHRVPAAKQAGKRFIEAEIRKGTRREAVLYSVGSNATHGLPRTNEDKRWAAELLLRDPEWRRWSDREIGRRCGVSWSFVGRVRDSICAPSTDAKRKFMRKGKDHLQRVRRRKMGRIAPEAIDLLRDSPIADSRDEMRRLSQKPPAQQVQILQQLIEHQARSVTAASFKVKKEDRRTQLHREVPELRRRGQYRTLVIDAPWPMPPGGRLSATQHYELMSLAEIRALPISDLAAADSHLYLWVVRSFLKEGLSLVEDWGFSLRSILTWVKTDNKGAPQFGSGHYFRGCTEHILFGVRGNAPAKRHDLSDVVFAPRGRHSAKPDETYELIERMSAGPYIDIFGRRKRAGWDVWGNEVGLLRAEEEKVA